MKNQAKLAALSILCALAFSTARADTRTRAITITSDAYSGSFAIDLMRDSSGAVTEMLYQTPDNPNGVLTLEELHQGPQVIFHTQDHDVILMSLENDFDPSHGGHVVVRYLQNGADGTYKDFRIRITIGSAVTLRSDPDLNDPDSDGNSYSGIFNRLFMEKNTFLGIVIGVQDVQPSYQQ